MPDDLRKYHQQTNRRLLIGFIILVLVVGLGLIYIFMGPEALFSGSLCLGASIIPIVLIMGFLKIIDWIISKNNSD